MEFMGSDGKPLPDESTISGVAWHGGFDIKLDEKQVNLILEMNSVAIVTVQCDLTLTQFK